MNNIGTQEIKTKRLLLRKVKESDYKDIYEYASKEEVAKYVTWPPHKSIEDTKALCKMWADEYKKENTYRWAVVYNNRVIGVTDVVEFINCSAVLGWCIDSLYWNQGIMTEAAAAVRDYMFGKVNVDNIFAAYVTENIGSGRVMQKIGMHAVSHEEYYSVLKTECESELNGRPVSCCRMTKDEWKNL
ncbi:MAG: GNAT family N-acetyltransferase [Eubacterium sp.]|nr:GNAT family N-acetyltransferase [Eubacterium sp.]